MAAREWTMIEIERFKQLLQSETSDRKIAKTLHCRRALVKQLRGLSDEKLKEALVSRTECVQSERPDWSQAVSWSEVIALIHKGYELKRIWEESAENHTTYSNFWKYLDRHHKNELMGTVTLREFKPGQQCEVDWAGDKIPWFDARGKLHEAHVFIGILCFSQYLFGYATGDEKQNSFINAHEKFFRSIGGAPAITVSDNLKAGVKSPDRYDAEIAPMYQEFAHHYQTAVVPARVYRPKDKALVENAVGLVMRYFRWRYRNKKFHSLLEINAALAEIATIINERKHSRFRVSRQSRLEQEQPVLRAMPENLFERVDWKEPVLHQDCTVEIDAAFYSAPEALRGKKLRAKLTDTHIEIFYNLARVAVHVRDRSQKGNRHVDLNHLPEKSRAYLEATPQSILSQARFINGKLHSLIDDLFKEDALIHLRRAQGLVRFARTEINEHGRAAATPRIDEAVEHMTRFNQIRVKTFRTTIERLRQSSALHQTKIDRDIVRRPGNPMLRKQEEVLPVQESLPGIIIPFPERR